jgi:HAD superfamily hydrolase (TIGR01509 family)
MIVSQKPKQSIIFDLDGTLVDSEKVWRKAMLQFFDELGIPEEETESVNRQLVGLTEQDAMQKISDTFTIPIAPEKLSERRLEIVGDLHATEAYLFDGVYDLLEALEYAGFKTAVATSSERSLAEYLIAKHNIRSFFDAILAAQDVANGKPHPEIFLAAAERICADPESCIVIEDSPHGLEAAKSAGMKAIAVKHNGIFSDEELLAKNPMRLVNHIGEISIEDFM